MSQRCFGQHRWHCQHHVRCLRQKWGWLLGGGKDRTWPILEAALQLKTVLDNGSFPTGVPVAVAYLEGVVFTA